MTKTQASEHRVRQVHPVDALLSVSTLGRIDYADAFEVGIEHPLERSAEDWMRTILEGAPVHMRIRLLSAWSAIGLKLRPPGSNRTILGWPIRDTVADSVLLGAHSRIGMPGELLLRRRDGGLLFATFVRQDNPIARRLWSTIEDSHVQTVRSLLERVRR
ncbi:hypothetical protein A5790_11745 [Mycobacterium sp. 852002-51152_SCH6134967]|uniref:hypothetical protein n=1 Tax=Mycobacterium sp. 852002-51152_SCH6134967 TaxID=1834096 RepID=UPI0007FC969F|nr:hypothetical protein [Mycobacterium sp. 852002-51152_SCH6134967]OBF93080.1 hypothetical protein A5790_11745 [Mycobacterium sp. 852002-51152_SCH6134967]